MKKNKNLIAITALATSAVYAAEEVKPPFIEDKELQKLSSPLANTPTIQPIPQERPLSREEIIEFINKNQAAIYQLEDELNSCIPILKEYLHNLSHETAQKAGPFDDKTLLKIKKIKEEIMQRETTVIELLRSFKDMDI